jgi:3-hydroxybutyrate dehydrogenase
MEFTNKTAVVTGSTSGIGLAIARELASKGANVVINGLGDPGEIEAARAGIAKDYGVQCTYSDANMMVPEQIRKMIGDAVAKFGSVDILVNNAGIQHVCPIDEFPEDKFDAIIAINLVSAFHATKAALPGMKAKHWGRIINIASVAGMRAVGSGRTAYGTSKGAVIALTRQMAVELAEHGITANAVSPGPVDTPMTKLLHTAKFKQEYSSAIPMNRYGTVSEVAAAVAFLASEQASYITGISMPVDGGFLASGARGI